MKSPGLQIDRRPLRYLAYADDIAIPAANIRSLTTAVRSLADEASKIGLEINVKKTVWMRQDRGNVKKERLIIRGTEIEQVDHFTYLGQNLCWPRNFSYEINKRISAIDFIEESQFEQAPFKSSLSDDSSVH
uniref:Reverse transcriptase domain-containing protein n=1 Tax=Panagrellus redivivus TaxID=6233 RepID=A0A7E4VPF8_PANRE